MSELVLVIIGIGAVVTGIVVALRAVDIVI